MVAGTVYLKVHYCLIRIEKSPLSDFFNKTISDLVYVVYMWRTPPHLLASSSVLVTLFPSENSFFIRLWKR